jgi:hypothetical protein
MLIKKKKKGFVGRLWPMPAILPTQEVEISRIEV